MVKKYRRIMLGEGSKHAEECFTGEFVGTDFDIDQDLSRNLPELWRDFNKKFIPVFLAKRPDKSKIAAGLACGAIWTVSKGMAPEDIVLSPDGNGSYRVGKVVGSYYYAEGQNLPHRRKVLWGDTSIPRADMSRELRLSTGSIGTVSDISNHAAEIQLLLGSPHHGVSDLVSSNPEIEDPLAFAMEKHLEDFLVENWDSTSLSQEYSIWEDEGEMVGQQYATDAGPIDILAISKDKKRILVIELKRGRTSDAVVGQTLRYMGYVKEQIAESDQSVEGAIIAFDDDQKTRWAIATVPSISFYRYQVNFKITKV
jgi:restriction system protein